MHFNIGFGVWFSVIFIDLYFSMGDWLWIKLLLNVVQDQVQKPNKTLNKEVWRASWLLLYFINNTVLVCS